MRNNQKFSGTQNRSESNTNSSSATNATFNRGEANVSGSQGGRKQGNGQNRDEERQTPDAESILERMDQNDDGIISLSDITARVLEHADDRLNRLDSDDDSLVSLTEYTDAPIRGNGRQLQDNEEVTREDMFSLIDTNVDGFINAAEYEEFLTQQVETHFNEIDTDSDATLSVEEIIAHHESRIADRAALENDTEDQSINSVSSSELPIVPPHYWATIDQDSQVVTSYTSGNDLVDDSSEFNLQLDFIGEGWTDSLISSVQNSADYFSALITNDIAADGLNDVSINFVLDSIDGEGDTIGSTISTHIWTDSSLPSQSDIVFDVDDIASYETSGLWDDVVTHEIFHALGFGSAWEALDLVEGSIDGLIYVGENAIAADTSGNISPVLETDGGTGTAYSHWDETVYGNEMMTGYIDDTTYISDMTLGALEDLGYSIDYSVSYDDFMIV